MRQTNSSPLGFPFSHRREKEEINTAWCQKKETLELEACHCSLKEKIKKKCKCKKEEEKEEKKEEEEKYVIHKDLLLKWVKGEIRGDLKESTVFQGNYSLRIILPPPHTV